MKQRCFSCLLFLVLVMASSCSKNDAPASKPVLSTMPISSITDSSATSGGSITSEGGSAITARGIMWDTSAVFSGASQVFIGMGTGNFTASLTRLSPATNWYVRAFATNSVGTGYGNTVQFSTSYTPNGYTVTTFAGSGVKGYDDGSVKTASFNSILGVAIDPSGIAYVAEDAPAGQIRKIGTDGMVTTLTANIGLGGSDVVVDATGNIYDLDVSRRLYKITPAGVVSLLAGSGANSSADGFGATASFSNPFSMDIDSAGTLYVTDLKVIRKVSPVGNVTTLSVSAIDTFNAVAVDRFKNLYVADGPRIRKIDASGNMTFIAGSRGSADGMGSAAGFGLVYELRVDKDGNIIATDGTNNKIRMITPAGLVTTVAGTGEPGATDGDGALATFSNPIGLAIDNAGNIFVGDLGNNKIRKITHK